MADALEVDFLIIGGGIAGASIGFELAAHGSVAVLEREAQVGYHATGRSAAVFIESYGNASIRALTRGSRAFLETPPDGFADGPLLTSKGLFYIARSDQLADLQAIFAAARTSGVELHYTSADELRRCIPILKHDYAIAGLYEPGVMEIDVAGLHHGYLRGLRARGGQVETDVSIDEIACSGGSWQVSGQDRSYRSPHVINAAGAWADEVAQLAGLEGLEMEPRRRTAILFDPPSELDLGQLPVVIDASEEFYFKGDAGRILASPADESLSPPCDAQPEEIDVATAAWRIEQATSLPVRTITHSWAGLRTFTKDRSPVIGHDPRAPGFFWFAGQGGYGVQIAPAAAKFGSELLVGNVAADGALAPDRFLITG